METCATCGEETEYPRMHFLAHLEEEERRFKWPPPGEVTVVEVDAEPAANSETITVTFDLPL